MFYFALVAGIWGLGTMGALLIAKSVKQREQAYKDQKRGGGK